MFVLMISLSHVMNMPSLTPNPEWLARHRPRGQYTLPTKQDLTAERDQNDTLNQFSHPPIGCAEGHLTVVRSQR